MLSYRPTLLFLSVVLAAGCQVTDAPIAAPPRVSLTSATPNPFNALSMVFTVFASNVDSARILYTAPNGSEGATPYVRFNGATATLVTLGLDPSTTYSNTVEAYGPLGRATAGPFYITSGALPPQLENVRLNIVGTPTSGYLLAPLTIDATTTAIVAFDSSGDIRWYRLFDTAGGGEDAQQQANGDFTIFLGTTRGYDDARGDFVEVAPSGELVRSFVAPDSLYTDGHELLLTFRGGALENAHFFGYERRIMTVVRSTGPIDTLLAVHTIVRLRADGSLAWRFPVDSLLTPADWIEPPPTLGDIDHPNSLTLDKDGNYVVSFRNAGEVTAIDSASGRILWRLGGAHNQFTFINDPLDGFSAQHFVRVLPNGHLLMFDNGWRHQPQESRAVEYALDIPARTATMVWQYRHSPPLFAQFIGSAQRLSNGNTLIGWGFFGIATEVDAAGSAVWEGTLSNGDQNHFYRILKVPSLYRYIAP